MREGERGGERSSARGEVRDLPLLCVKVNQGSGACVSGPARLRLPRFFWTTSLVFSPLSASHFHQSYLLVLPSCCTSPTVCTFTPSLPPSDLKFTQTSPSPPPPCARLIFLFSFSISFLVLFFYLFLLIFFPNSPLFSLSSYLLPLMYLLPRTDPSVSLRFLSSLLIHILKILSLHLFLFSSPFCSICPFQFIPIHQMLPCSLQLTFSSWRWIKNIARVLTCPQDLFLFLTPCLLSQPPSCLLLFSLVAIFTSLRKKQMKRLIPEKRRQPDLR